MVSVETGNRTDLVAAATLFSSTLMATEAAIEAMLAKFKSVRPLTSACNFPFFAIVYTNDFCGRITTSFVSMSIFGDIWVLLVYSVWCSYC